MTYGKYIVELKSQTFHEVTNALDEREVNRDDLGPDELLVPSSLGAMQYTIDKSFLLWDVALNVQHERHVRIAFWILSNAISGWPVWIQFSRVLAIQALCHVYVRR